MAMQLVADRGAAIAIGWCRGMAERLDHFTKTSMKEAWNKS